MFRLRTFGGLSLESDLEPVPPSATQRRRLAFLVLLAAAGERGVTREKLFGYLWAESPEEKARHALEQLLYATRRDLGKDAVRSSSGILRLNPGLVWADVTQFEAALEQGELEEAVGLYAGPFLDGVYLDAAPAFERWAESERLRLQQRFAGTLEELAEAATARGDVRSAAEWWRRLAATDPLSARFAAGLIRALAATGDRAAALRQARIYEELVRQELDLEPDPAVVALVDGLRDTPPSPAEVSPPPPPAALRTPAAESAGPAPAAAVRRPRLRPRAWLLSTPSLAAALSALVVLSLGAWALSRGESSPPPSIAPPPASLVVLPFVDMSPARDAEYFGDGMTEELIHALSRVEGLRVVARTSAFTFKGRNVDVREIGKALGVRAVLEGSVRQSGDRLKITVQLVDAQSGYHLWSETYDRETDDVFAVQEQISRAVVRTLHPALLRSSPTPLVSTATQNAEAYQLYMQGRYFWNQRTEEGLHKAIDQFEQAIRLDSSYAAAYSGLSDAYNSLADNGYMPSGPALEKAEVAVRTALRLDSELAEGYSSLGHLKLHRWDWTGAEQDFRRSVELNPGYAVAYQYYAFLLAFQGRFEESLPLIRRAQHLDPLSLAIQNNVGEILYLARRYPEAAEQLRFVLQMDSTRRDTRWMLARSLTELGRYEEAIAELQRVIAMDGGWHRSAVATLGYTYARAGQSTEAEQVRREIERAQREGRTISPVYTAALLGVLGRRDEALVLLDEAILNQTSGLVTLAVNPMLDPLRSDPRFAASLRRLGFPASEP